MSLEVKLGLLVDAAYSKLMENPNQFFRLRSIVELGKENTWTPSEIFLRDNTTKIVKRLIRKEGIYSLGNSHSLQFFYSPSTLPATCKWKKSTVKNWINWAIQNKNNQPESFTQFPEMDIAFQLYFVSDGPNHKLRFFFPHQIRVFWEGQESTVWELSLLKIPKLKPVLGREK